MTARRTRHGATTAPREARRSNERRAFSLLELTAVIAILGVLAAMAAARFGTTAVETVGAEGVARELSMAFRLARQQAICEGIDAAVVLNRNAGAVRSFTVVRAAGGGDEPVEALYSVPDGVTVTAPSDRWRFDFTGALTTPAGGVLTITSPGWTWTLTLYGGTGTPTVARASS